MIPLFLRFCQPVFGPGTEVNLFLLCLKVTDGLFGYISLQMHIEENKQEKQFNLFYFHS